MLAGGAAYRRRGLHALAQAREDFLIFQTPLTSDTRTATCGCFVFLSPLNASEPGENAL